MGALSDLWKSERGLVGLAIILATTVLFALGRISSEQWTTIIQWTFATYVAGKSVTSAIGIHAAASSKKSDEFTSTLSSALEMYMASMSQPSSGPTATSYPPTADDIKAARDAVRDTDDRIKADNGREVQ